MSSRQPQAAVVTNRGPIRINCKRPLTTPTTPGTGPSAGIPWDSSKKTILEDPSQPEDKDAGDKNIEAGVGKWPSTTIVNGPIPSNRSTLYHIQHMISSRNRRQGEDKTGIARLYWIPIGPHCGGHHGLESRSLQQLLHQSHLLSSTRQNISKTYPVSCSQKADLHQCGEGWGCRPCRPRQPHQNCA